MRQPGLRRIGTWHRHESSTARTAAASALLRRRLLRVVLGRRARLCDDERRVLMEGMVGARVPQDREGGSGGLLRASLPFDIAAVFRRSRVPKDVLMRQGLNKGVVTLEQLVVARGIILLKLVLKNTSTVRLPITVPLHHSDKFSYFVECDALGRQVGIIIWSLIAVVVQQHGERAIRVASCGQQGFGARTATDGLNGGSRLLVGPAPQRDDLVSTRSPALFLETVDQSKRFAKHSSVDNHERI